jgi:hypothetical protein
MKPEFEFRKCVHCDAHYIEECPQIEVVIGGKPELPEGCWRRDKVELKAKSHKKKSDNDI